MERGEEDVEVNYARGQEAVDCAYAIVQDKRDAEEILMGLPGEDRLRSVA